MAAPLSEEGGLGGVGMGGVGMSGMGDGGSYRETRERKREDTMRFTRWEKMTCDKKSHAFLTLKAEQCFLKKK